jgi:hypothetical protein
MARLGTGEPRGQELSVGAARFRIVYWPEDAAAAAQVRRALQKAAPRVSRWGGLRQPVTVTLYPSHEALEGAVDRPGYEWLKAWARYATIDLQSPRTWGFFGASDRKVEELITHELTHCAMYQMAGDEMSWMFKQIPVWFSEGIANVAANWGYRYGGIEEIFKYYQRRLPGSGGGIPGSMRPPRVPVALPGDPIVDPGPIYQDQSEIVYGAAYYAAQFLIQRYGDERIKRLLELMGSGKRFPAAFKEAIGLTDAEFASDFRRYVVWQGWRR